MKIYFTFKPFKNVYYYLTFSKTFKNHDYAMRFHKKLLDSKKVFELSMSYDTPKFYNKITIRELDEIITNKGDQ